MITKTIFALEGDNGDWDEMNHWTICVVNTEEEAKKMVVLCNKEQDRILDWFKKRPGEPSYDYEDLCEDKLLDAHKYDKYFRIEKRGVTYSYKEINLIEFDEGELNDEN